VFLAAWRTVAGEPAEPAHVRVKQPHADSERLLLDAVAVRDQLYKRDLRSGTTLARIGHRQIAWVHTEPHPVEPSDRGL
jgi:hypothetical protein